MNLADWNEMVEADRLLQEMRVAEREVEGLITKSDNLFLNSGRNPTDENILILESAMLDLIKAEHVASIARLKWRIARIRQKIKDGKL